MENGHDELNPPTFMIEVSVIIPTCNRPDDLARCLRALEPQMGQHSYEVIVSDDSHDASTQAMLQTKFPTVKITTGPRRGPGANRNAGAMHASGKLMMMSFRLPVSSSRIAQPSQARGHTTFFMD